MAITAEQLAEIRAHIGDDTPPTDADLGAAFDRLGTTSAVALEVVRKRLAALRAKAAKFSAEGDYTEDWSANILALERQAKSLTVDAAAAAAGDTSGEVTVGLLTRTHGRRR